MASASNTVSPLRPGVYRIGCSTRPLLSSFLPLNARLRSPSRRRLGWRSSGRGTRAMAEQAVQQGPSAAYARDMERLSAKESLLLALKDAGGFDALITGKVTAISKIDVTERIAGLERLNPTPRPTTSPFLEGRWKLEWFGSDAPGLLATRLVFEVLPSTLFNLSRVDVQLRDGNAKVTANMKFLNSVEAKFVLSSKLSVEGPLRMKEESVEGMLDSPIVIEQAVPEQLRSALVQASTAFQQIPFSIRDAFSGGVTVPLNGTFQRLFMISYLDDEILVIRDTAGLTEVLTRLDVVPSLESPEYES